MKSKLLRNSYIKKLNHRFKARKFYKGGISRNKNSKRILFWTTGGMIIQSHLEGVVAVALKMRGHDVRMVLCDSVYKACARRVDFPDVEMKDWGKYCSSCIRQNSQVFDRLGLNYSYISQLVPPQKASELRQIADSVTFQNFKTLTYNGLPVGSHLESAMMRHTRGGSLEGLEDLLREYAFVVLVNAAASADAISTYKPDRICMSHGIYADWGPALSEALNAGIPVTSYICCYLTAHFYFGTVSKFKETFLNVSDESWNKIKTQPLTTSQTERVEHFLDQRYRHNVTRDMQGLLKNYRGDRDHFFSQYGLSNDKPVWGIMTHINWDAVSDYFPMLHKSFDDWLGETIKAIWNITEVQWLIKIHPSEINDNPLTGCQKYIEKNFPNLPDHIKVLKMDDDISPLDFYSLLDGGVTVMGTGGLELALQGKPVILAGEAHYSGKGFTFDPKSDEEYKKLLASVAQIGKLDKQQSDLAWKYGYTYFISKQIPLLPNVGEDLHIQFNMIDRLLPGKNKYMDFICEKIIDSNDFIMPDELVEMNHPEDKEQIRKSM